jgi:hypothetical protein
MSAQFTSGPMMRQAIKSGMSCSNHPFRSKAHDKTLKAGKKTIHYPKLSAGSV